VNLIVGTTGWRPADAGLDRVAAAGGGVVHGANFSLGVQAFLRLAREAARLANAVGGYDAYILETHHRHKRDQPSGTAIRLADAVTEELQDKSRWSAGPPDGQADPRVLYVTSVRAGEVTGTHLVGFEGLDDQLELRHEARSRAGFARGALRAAEWVRHRAGVYSFEEVVADLLDPITARSAAR
jgi:4-hydroxy-tetrahydrodipicolinate reductase